MPNKYKISVVLFVIFLITFTVLRTIKDGVIEPPKEVAVVSTEKDSTEVTPAPVVDINQKKRDFFSLMRPGIAEEKARIDGERSTLLSIQTALPLQAISEEQLSTAQQLSELYQYDLPEQGITMAWLTEMLTRVNYIPQALILTQAANESAWGTSRFAKQANNYFGQWCYRKGCGLVPLQRAEGMTHEVAKFNSVNESIHRYYMNINRNPAYADLRAIRNQLSSDGVPLTSVEAALALTHGLSKYSERGQDYVNDLQLMINTNAKYWQESN